MAKTLKQSKLSFYKVQEPQVSKDKVTKLEIKTMKQATLSSLKGVVIYEDIFRHKSLLETENQLLEVLVSSLEHLSEKQPCREALLTTDIYTTVKKLCKHEEEEVTKIAKDLSNNWKTVIEGENSQSKPLMEVRYDLKTAHFRKTAIQMIEKELDDSEKNRKLADALEKEIFHISKRLVTGTYRRTTRKIVFVLKNDNAEKIALQNGKILPTKFVQKYRR